MNTNPGVITINDNDTEDTDVVMLPAEEESQETNASNPEQIAISDDECVENTENSHKPTLNHEEIVISDDESDNNVENTDGTEATPILECLESSQESTLPENAMEQENIQNESIEITFSSEKLLVKHKAKFKNFLQSFKTFKYLECKDNKLLLTNDRDLNGWVVINSIDDENDVEFEDANQSSEKKRKRIDKNDDIDDLKDKRIQNLFILDTEPSNEVTYSPIYRSKYKFIEENAENNDEDANITKKKELNRICCFNCDGHHSLRDCPLPKDNRRIKIARQKMNVKQLVRYHEESDAKYNNVKPGVISDTLKKALGLRKHDIPPHVYKMRVMGYPPGWLEEAKVFNSNLALFDSEGKKDAISKGCNSYTIAPEKIIDYPGFNCKPDRGFKDNYNYFGVPPYSTALSKENMIDFVNKMLQTEATAQIEQTTSNKSPSPSLNDLELQKRQLLEQLTTSDDDNDNDDSNNSNSLLENSTKSPNITSNEDKTAINDSIDLSQEETNKSTEETIDFESLDKTINLSSDINECELTPSTPLSSSVENSLKSINKSLPGTPIIKALSPYARLPCLDNFQKDVSPVINFENLPNATGKYEQMSAVLEKVRNTLKSRFQT